jgi:hypothetical protein
LVAAAAGTVAIFEGMPPAGVGLVFVALGMVYILNDTGRLTEKMKMVPHAAPLEGTLYEIENDIEKVTQEVRAARSEIQYLTERLDFLVNHVTSASPMVPASTMRPSRNQLVTRQHPDGNWRRKGTTDGWEP